jgi:hypothetical protein
LKAALLAVEQSGGRNTRATAALTRKLVLWHKRLYHPSAKRLRLTIKRITGIDLNPKHIIDLPCLACDQAKSTKIPSLDSPKPATYTGEIIWCDLGSVNPESINGHKYYALITDEYSRFRSFHALKHKDEVQEILISYIMAIIAKLEARPTANGQTKPKITVIRIDGGKEFKITILQKECGNYGIEMVNSTPHNQYQNGIPERGIRLLQNEAKAIVIQMKIPTYFWDKVLAAVCYTFNRTG